MSGAAPLPPVAFEMATGGASFALLLCRDGMEWRVQMALGGAHAGSPKVSQDLTSIGAVELGRALIRFGELAARPGVVPE